MKKTNILPVLMACCLIPACAYAAPAPKAPTPADRANALAFRFYGIEAKQPGNIFFSPYSMRTAFAMAQEGARGATAEQIQKAFNFPQKNKAMRSEIEDLAGIVNKAAKGAEFTQANSFWAQQDYAFLPAYTSVLKKNYGAEAGTVDFKNKTEAARTEINAWTGGKTGGKIKELFADGALDSLTRLVLVNAVYFKGTWQTAFKKDMTFDADFTLNSGEKIKTPMMSYGDGEEAEYGETATTQQLRLRYKTAGKDNGLAMLIVLPRDKAAFARLENELSADKFRQLRSGLAMDKAKVFLPRFSFSSSFLLNKTLAGLGMPLAFTDSADFSGMDGKTDLYIQKAVQKAFVEVNEAGTEAAAATGVAMGLKSINFDMPVFRADKPFIFFIEDVKSGLLLFMGRVENPSRK